MAISLAILGQMAFGQGFSSLTLPANARVAALGGYAVSNADGDVFMTFNNPALQDSVEVGSFGFLVNPFFADITRFSAIGQLATAFTGPFSIGAVYTGYGDFVRRDVIGNDVGEFSARDYVVQISKSHSIGPFVLGLAAKFVGSHIDTQQNTAVLADLGGIFRHPNQEFVVGMVFKNMGWLFADGSVESPFDIEIGTTFKPQYMPLRFTFTVYDLVGNNPAFSNTPNENVDNLDEVLRHLNIGGAFVFGKNLEILLGYNQKRRQELGLNDSAFGAGLSFGLLLKLRELQLRFSRSTFHAAGGTSFISLQSNMRALKKTF